VRVPAVIISPYVPAGSIVRPPARPGHDPPFPFDHCSIPATLHQLFDLGPPLTPRVAAAPDLLGALSLMQPENNGPEHIPVERMGPSTAEVRAHRSLPRNHHQKILRSPALGLPGAVAGVAAQLRRLGAKAIPQTSRRR
jgi:phospholipase C